MITADDVRAAARVLEGVAHRTPPITSRTLGEHVVLKPECLQRGGAFKFRGAYNKIASLPAGTPVVAFSSGNHAQAVALASRLLGTQRDDPDARGRAGLEARRDARLRRRGRHLRPLQRGSRGARRRARGGARPRARAALRRPADHGGRGNGGARADRGRRAVRHARDAGRRRRADRRHRDDRPRPRRAAGGRRRARGRRRLAAVVRRAASASASTCRARSRTGCRRPSRAA